MSEPITVDLGAVTAYADAVEQGYTGTREEFGELLANFANRADEVKQNKEEVKQAKEAVFSKAESFDKHVEDEKVRVTEEFNANAEQVLQTNKQEIGNAKIEALESIANLKEDAVTQVNKTKTDGVQEIITLTNEKKSLLENTGTNQKNLVESEGTKQIQDVENKGAKTLQTIPEDYTALNNTVNILSDLMNTKAPAIVEEAKSGTEITVTDSAEMPLQGLRLYGKSKQVATTGKNLCSIKSCQLSTKLVTSDIVPWTKSSQIYYAFDTQNISGAQAYISIKYHDADKKIVGSNGNTIACDGTRKTGSFNGKYANSGSDIDLTTIEYISVQLGLYRDSATPSLIDNIMVSDDKNAPFEPYTGGKPSPSPEYPQEIVSVGGNGSIEVNVRGKNLVDIYGYSANGLDNPEEKRALNNAYGTTLNTTEKTDKLIVNQEILDGAVAGNYTSGYFCIGINRKFEVNKYYIITFRINVIRNPLSISEVLVSFNGVTFSRAKVIGDKVTVKAEYKELGKRQYVEVRNNGMSVEFSDFMITEVGETDDYEPYKQSTATIPLQNGLPGIPVSSGGNYTDENGQRYICDEIDFNRGKYIQRVWKGVFDGSEDELWAVVNNEKPFRVEKAMPEDMYYRTGFCNRYKSVISFIDTGVIFGINNTAIYMSDSGVYDRTLPDKGLSKWKAYLAEHQIKVMTYLNTPIETDLTEAQIQAYKSLTTFKPTSIISNDANTWMGASYVADTKLYIDSKIQEIASAIIASASEAE